MRFKGLDLNLLVAFECLMRTRSVARSAEALGLSQPAVSAALSRLRSYFQDSLLVLEGKKFYPTPVAQSLLPLVEQCLHDATLLVAATRGFDASTSQRTFRIAASDYTAVVVLARFARTLEVIAPGICLDILPPQAELRRQFQDGALDLMIGPEAYALADMPSELLYEESYVVIGCADNPIFQRKIEAEDITAAGHVMASFGASRVPAFADQQLTALGIIRRIEISTSSFLTVPWYLIGTKRLAIMHRRLAECLADLNHLKFCHLPMPLPPASFVLQYPLAAREDPGLKWLRDRVKAAL